MAIIIDTGQFRSLVDPNQNPPVIAVRYVKNLAKTLLIINETTAAIFNGLCLYTSEEDSPEKKHYIRSLCTSLKDLQGFNTLLFNPTFAQISSDISDIVPDKQFTEIKIQEIINTLHATLDMITSLGNINL